MPARCKLSTRNTNRSTHTKKSILIYRCVVQVAIGRHGFDKNGYMDVNHISVLTIYTANLLLIRNALTIILLIQINISLVFEL